MKKKKITEPERKFLDSKLREYREHVQYVERVLAESSEFRKWLAEPETKEAWRKHRTKVGERLTPNQFMQWAQSRFSQLAMYGHHKFATATSNKNLLHPKLAAEYGHVTLRAIQMAVKEGRLPSVGKGRQRRIPLEAVRSYFPDNS